jgi:hypothetical protein
LAVAKAINPEIRAFGGMMVTDHTKSTAMVTAAARKSENPRLRRPR